MREFLRVFNKRIISVTIICLIANVGLFAYTQLAGKSYSEFKEVNHVYTSFIDEYKDADLKEGYNAIKEMRKRDDLTEHEQAAYKLVNSQMKHLYGYSDYVDGVLENAERMSGRVIFSDKDSKAYKNIVKSTADYERVDDVAVEVGNTRAVTNVLDYSYYLVFVVGIMVLIIYKMFQERDNSVWDIVRLGKYGRAHLTGRRLVILLVITMLLMSLFFGSTVITSCAMYGGFDWFAAAQCLEILANYTLPVSIGGFVMFFFALELLGVSMIVIVMWMVLAIFRNRNVSLVILAIICGLEYILFTAFTDLTIMKMYRKYNIFTLFNLDELMTTYTNDTIAFAMLEDDVTMMILSLLVLLCASIVGFVVSVRLYPSGKVGKVKLIIDWISEHFQMLFSRAPVIIKEMYKMYFTSKGLVVVIFMVALCIYFVTESKVEFSDTEKMLDELYLESGGRDYGAIEERINKLYDDIEEADRYAMEISEKYKAGEATLEEFVDAVSAGDVYRMRLKPYTEAIQKLDYVKQMKEERGVDIWLVSDRGYEQIFGVDSKQRETFLLIIMCVGVFLIVNKSILLEYKTGMKAVNNYTVKGRNWLFIRKIASVVIAAATLWLVVYSIDYISLYKMYGMPYLSAPLCSLSFMEDAKAGVTIMEHMTGKCIAGLLISVSSGCLSVVASKLMAGYRGWTS